MNSIFRITKWGPIIFFHPFFRNFFQMYTNLVFLKTSRYTKFNFMNYFPLSSCLGESPLDIVLTCRGITSPPLTTSSHYLRYLGPPETPETSQYQCPKKRYAGMCPHEQYQPFFLLHPVPHPINLPLKPL